MVAIDECLRVAREAGYVCLSFEEHARYIESQRGALRAVADDTAELLAEVADNPSRLTQHLDVVADYVHDLSTALKALETAKMPARITPIWLEAGQEVEVRDIGNMWRKARIHCVSDADFAATVVYEDGQTDYVRAVMRPVSDGS